MTTRRIRLDDLQGRLIHDADGHRIGRIFDMRAEEHDGELVIVEYMIGARGLVQRVGLSMMRLVGFGGRDPWKIPWDRLDISDPDHPVLRD